MTIILHILSSRAHGRNQNLVLRGHLLQDTTPLAMRSEEVEKAFTLPLSRYQIRGRDGSVGEVVIKPDALQVVTRDANRLWIRLQEEGCSIKEIRSNQSKFIGFYF